MEYESVLMLVVAAPPATCLAYLGREAYVWRRRLAESERELLRVRRAAAKVTGLRRPR